jgi:signal transduction histidine kinase
LVIEGKSLGVLYLRSKEPHEFSQRQIEIAKAIASQAAIAIDRSRRYEQLKTMKGFVGTHTAIDWLKMVSTSWGHSIKSEVATALGRVALIRGLLNGQTNPEVHRELAHLENAIGAIRDIPITAPLSYEDATEWVSVNALLQTHLDRLWRHSRYKQVALRYDLEPELDQRVVVWASKEWLYRGLEIVIDNAVWAMHDEPHQQITIQTRCSVGQVKIMVADTGPGIPDAVAGLLFKRPIPKSEGSRGSGIGLLLAQTIFQTYEGDIRLAATGNSGTEFEISLPARPGSGTV